MDTTEEVDFYTSGNPGKIGTGPSPTEQEIYNKFIDDYGLKDTKPDMIFSIIGDSVDFVPQPWPRRKLQKALVDAARDMGESWITYKGEKSGLSQMIQEAVEEYEHLEWYTYDGKRIDRNGKFIRLISVPNYQKSSLKEAEEKEMEKTKDSLCLHFSTHHLKIEDREDYARLRIKFEQNLANSGVSKGEKEWFPIILVLLEGDISTIEHARIAVEGNIPIVIVKGTGKAADVIANYLQNNDELRRIISVFFGKDFDEKGQNILKSLDILKEHRWLVNIYDIKEEDAARFPIVVGESLLRARLQQEQHQKQVSQKEKKSMKDLLKAVQSPGYFEQLPNDSREKAFSTFLKQSMGHSKQERTVQNQTISSPLSLPLHFLSQLQHMQEKKDNEIAQNMLLEALQANRIDYVETFLDEGFTIQDRHLKELYKTFSYCCLSKSSEEKKCFHMKWILTEVDKKTAERLFGSESHANVQRCAEEICRKILGYNRTEDLRSESNVVRLTLKKKEQYMKYQDLLRKLLLWSVYANRKELATLFWKRIENQLLAGLVCYKLLDELSKRAYNIKEEDLATSLEEHAGIFNKRNVQMMTELYSTDMIATFRILDRLETIWSIQSTPLTFAHENRIYDVIALQSTQRWLNEKWYNTLAPDFIPFIKSFRNEPGGVLKSLFTKYVVNYIIFALMLLSFSYYVLTDVKKFSDQSTLSKVLECFIYAWNVGDFFEEFKAVAGFLRNEKSSRTLKQRLITHLSDFWNQVDCTTYVSLAFAVVFRIRIHDFDSERVARRLFCLTLIFLYLRYIQVFLMMKRMGCILLLIENMLKDLLRFLAIMIVPVLAVGIFYHALLFPNYPYLFAGHWFDFRIWEVVYYPYWQMLGGDFRAYLDEGDPECEEKVDVVFNMTIHPCPQKDWAVALASSIFMLLSNLLVVNLTISMFRFTEMSLKTAIHERSKRAQGMFSGTKLRYIVVSIIARKQKYVMKNN